MARTHSLLLSSILLACACSSGEIIDESGDNANDTETNGVPEVSTEDPRPVDEPKEPVDDPPVDEPKEPVDDPPVDEPKEPVDDPPVDPPTGDYSLRVSPSSEQINLGEETRFTAEVTSDDFSGPVELALDGVPESWDVDFSPSRTFDLTAGESVDVQVTISVPTNAEAANADISFAVSGDLGDRSANASLNVDNQVVMNFQRGSGSGDHGIGGTLNLRQGTNLVIVNGDNISHEVHANVHQDGPMGPGERYTLRYPRSTDDQVYCHTHGRNAGLIRVNVQ